ncbi:MAG: hypothetical protein WC102_04760 [Saccharofermentanales bacterium]
MSHFTVLVLMRDDQLLENVLAPFDENKEVPPYISMKRDEFIADKRKIYKRDIERDEESGDEIVIDYESMTDEEFLQAMRALDYTLDDAGNEITTYNKLSQWDWWAVGGRWSNLLRLTPEAYKNYIEDKYTSGEIVLSSSGREPGRCNAAKVKYLDFSSDPEIHARSLRFWDLYVSKMAKAETEEDEEQIKSVRYAPEFYKERYGTRENYAQLESSFETWAVVTPDGKWHEKGSMGWWGLSNESNERACEWTKNIQGEVYRHSRSGTGSSTRRLPHLRCCNVLVMKTFLCRNCMMKDHV